MTENEIMTADESVEEVEIQVIDMDEEEMAVIDSDVAFAALGVPNEQLNHALLYNRDEPEQHTIEAITGLRKELDDIYDLKTLYSDKKQQADYYLWHDENPLAENRDGLFVSMHKATAHNEFHSALCCIEKCDGNQDVFGVTVAEAAFIGGQTYIEIEKTYENGVEYTRKQMINNDCRYGLVVHSGLAGVRCMPSVVVGDYVVPNARGEAKKSDGNYGYLVVSLSEINGVQYAVISLNASSTLGKTTADSVQDLSERMSTAEYNITSVTNVANSAYALAKDAQESADNNSKYTEDKITEAFDKIGAIDKEVGSLTESVIGACENAKWAQVTAESAVSSAEAIRSEAVDKANEANANVNNLIKDLEPITTWSDPETGNTGAEYLTTYINNGLATKVEVQTVETKTDEALSAVEQNAKSIQSLVSTIDKYVIGEYSQAYGLTQEQAKSILPVGIIYVPTIKHEGQYIYNGTEFQLGYYYEWDGERWVPSQSTAVNFSSQYIQGTEATPYWVVTESDVVENSVTYDLGGLYKWENGEWVKVASVADNTLSRAVSAIKQTTNSITAEVSNVKGDVSALDIRVTGAETSLTTLTTWKGEAEDSMAVIEQKADENGASIAQVVSAVGKDGEVTASSIVQAINDGKSSVSISGDYINLTGKVTFSSFDAETKRKIEADSIDVQIWSSRGNIFKSRDVSTILTCHVFSAGVDITDTLPSSAFTWVKINNDGTQDETWSATPYGSNVNAIQISPSDIWSRAVFTCKVEI